MSSDTVENSAGGAGGRKANFNTYAAVFFILFSLLLLWIIPGQIEEPMIVLGDSALNLSPELFPQIVASSFGVLGVWFFFKSFSVTDRNKLLDLDREAIINVSITLGAMAGYVVLMMTVGFVVGSATLIAFLATFFGNKNYYLTAAVSIIIPVAIFMMFTKVLATSLPPFPIDTILTRLSIL